MKTLVRLLQQLGTQPQSSRCVAEGRRYLRIVSLNRVQLPADAKSKKSHTGGVRTRSVGSRRHFYSGVLAVAPHPRSTGEEQQTSSPGSTS